MSSREACSTNQRTGLSLLEVILALAILAIATAYLTQAMQLATTNGLRAQKLIKAELVAESIVSQVVAGLLPSDTTSWTYYSNSTGQTDWMYQLTPVQTELEGMIGFQIALQQVDPRVGLVQNEHDLLINRWIIDPQLGLDTPLEETEEETTDTGGSF